MSFVSKSTIAFALGLALPTLHFTVAFAQSTTAPTTGGAAPAGGTSSGGGAAPTVTTVPGPTTTTYFPGGVAPPPPGGTLGGGNVQFSSSKPISGNERDSFDFKGGAGAGSNSVRGEPNGSFTLGGGGERGVYAGGVVPGSHNVRRGDTLWGICDFYFRNPYQWPRVWSYNPQIQNPHWIYPGDQVKLRTGSGEQVAALAPQPGTKNTVTERRRTVSADTIFLRNEGFIEDESTNWGEINGAREDKLFLADYDEVYLRIGADHDVKVGQDLTVYRPIKTIGSGKLIEIQGTVKVDSWNPKERVARARVTETLDTIERGARVGPIARKFEVVAPVRNEKDVDATILTSVHPHEVYGQNQVVFLDKGEENGLKPGNRLFVMRKGDGFHKTQPTGSAAKRIAIEDQSAGAMESVTKPKNDNGLPDEVAAELRVINVKKNTAMALVTASRQEIELGEKAQARKGY